MRTRTGWSPNSTTTAKRCRRGGVHVNNQFVLARVRHNPPVFFSATRSPSALTRSLQSATPCSSRYPPAAICVTGIGGDEGVEHSGLTNTHSVFRSDRGIYMSGLYIHIENCMTSYKTWGSCDVRYGGRLDFIVVYENECELGIAVAAEMVYREPDLSPSTPYMAQIGHTSTQHKPPTKSTF